MAQARSGADARGGGPKISDAADVMAGAVRDALAGIDSILSFRPSGSAPSGPSAPAAPARPEPPAEPEQSWSQATEAEHADDPTERA
jgi:hypothetical protein